MEWKHSNYTKKQSTAINIDLNQERELHLLIVSLSPLSILECVLTDITTGLRTSKPTIGDSKFRACRRPRVFKRTSSSFS